MRIGIDLMGSDRPPHVLFDAVLQGSKELTSSCALVVIATHSVVNELKTMHHAVLNVPGTAQIEFYPVCDSIAMADDPLFAFCNKKESSLAVGIRLLKRKKLDAFVSAGNTGALVAGAALSLPHLPGVKRPALLVVLPTVTGSVAVLDVGGTVLCKPHHLVQFAYMGAAYQRCMQGIEKPKVGLLNIGIEPKKGSSVARQAYQALCENAVSAAVNMHFLGNVEGRDVFQGGIDVLVTDGFTGNVLLKTSEGLSSFIFEHIQEALQPFASEKLHQTFKELKRSFSYSEYPGALVCGVEGVVVKCHGNSSTKAILNGIKGAVRLVDQQLIPRLKEQLGVFHKSDSSSTSSL